MQLSEMSNEELYIVYKDFKDMQKNMYIPQNARLRQLAKEKFTSANYLECQLIGNAVCVEIADRYFSNKKV